MFSHRKITILFLLVAILSVVLKSNGPWENNATSPLNRIPTTALFHKDPVVNYLGKSFSEIRQVLGEPDEQGYASYPGSHYYMLFRQKPGVIRFTSLENIEKRIVVSISLGGGQEVLGTRTGMTFDEIIHVLGEPNSGPETGLDNLYYVEYYFGGLKNHIPEVVLSYIAVTMSSPVHEILLKWEAIGNWDEEQAF